MYTRKTKKEEDTIEMTDIGLNTIFYGPPGTGKTYQTVIYAVAIIENKPLAEVAQENYDAVFARYTGYKEKGRIAFTTFHQSYGYEEFIEGIRPVIASGDECDDKSELSYDVLPAFSNDFAGPQNSMRMRALTSIRLMQTRTFGRYRCALPGTIRSAPNAYTMGTFELLGGIPMAKSSWIRIFPRRGAAKY